MANFSVGHKTAYFATAVHSPHLFQISFHIGQFACFNVCILATHSRNAIFAFGNTIVNPSDWLTTDNFTQSITIIRRLTDDTVSLLTEHSSPEGNLHWTHWLVKSSQKKDKSMLTNRKPMQLTQNVMCNMFYHTTRHIINC